MRKFGQLKFWQRVAIITQLSREQLADDEQCRQLLVVASDEELLAFAHDLSIDFGEDVA